MAKSVFEVPVTLNLKQLRQQIQNIENTDLSISIKTEFKEKAQELIRIVENLNHIKELATGKWSNNDILSGLLDVSKKLNTELKKTDKDENIITVYQKQLLKLADAYKETQDAFKGKNLSDVAFKKLFQNTGKNDKDIKLVTSQLDGLKARINEFGDIKSISLGSLIDKKDIDQYLGYLKDVAKEFEKEFNIKVTPNIKIGDVLTKEDIGKDINVTADLKPTISDPQAFADEASEILKNAGVKVGVEIEGKISDIEAFKNGIENQLSNTSVGINVTPNDESITDFADQIKSKVGSVEVDVLADTHIKEKPIEQPEIVSTGALGSSTVSSDVIKRQEELQKKLKETNSAIKNQEEWLKRLSVVEKDYKTSNKKEANDQLRDATKALQNYRNNPEDYAASSLPDGDLINIRWYRAMQEAKRQGSSRQILSRYNTDIDEYTYIDSVEKVGQIYDLHLKILAECQEEAREYREELLKLGDVSERTDYLKSEYEKLGEFQNIIEKLRESYGREDVYIDEARGETNLEGFMARFPEYISLLKEFRSGNYHEAINNLTNAFVELEERERYFTDGSNANSFIEDFSNLSLEKQLSFFDEITKSSKEGERNLKEFNNELLTVEALLNDGRNITASREAAWWADPSGAEEWKQIRNKVTGFSFDHVSLDDLRANADVALANIGDIIQDELDKIEPQIKSRLVNLFKLDDNELSIFNSLDSEGAVNSRLIETGMDYLERIKNQADQASDSIDRLNSSLNDEGKVESKSDTNNFNFVPTIEDPEKVRQELSSAIGEVPVNVKPQITQEDEVKSDISSAIGTIPIDIYYNTDNRDDDAMAISNGIGSVAINVKPTISDESKETTKSEIVTQIGDVPINIEPVVSQDDVENIKNKIKSDIGVVSIDTDLNVIHNDNADSSSITEFVNAEKQAVEQATKAEAEAFDNLENKIRTGVTDAINQKTNAIIEEAAQTNKALDGEIQQFLVMSDAVDTIAKALGNLSANTDGDAKTNLNEVRDALVALSKINFKSMDFSKITNFLQSISEKSSDDIRKFSRRVESIKTAFEKMNGIDVQNLNNVDALKNLTTLIKQFPSEDKSKSFATAATNVRTGLEQLIGVGTNEISSPNNILNVIERMLSKSKELEHYATILSKPKSIVKDAKEEARNQAKQQKEDTVTANQRSVQSAISGLKDATDAYGREMINSAKNKNEVIISQQAVDNLNNAKKALTDLLNVTTLTKEQIKQVGNALDASSNSVNNFQAKADAIIDKTNQKLNDDNKRLLEQINSGVDSGKFDKQFTSLYKDLDKFTVSSDETAKSLEKLKDLLGQLNDPTLSDTDRIKVFDNYKKEADSISKIINANKQTYAIDSDEKKRIDNLQKQRSLYAEINNIRESLGSSAIYNQIANDYTDINKAIERGKTLTEDQLKKLEKWRDILKSTYRYQSQDTFLSQSASSIDQAKSVINDYLTKNFKRVNTTALDSGITKDGIRTLTAQAVNYDGIINDITFSWNEASQAISFHAKEGGKQLMGVSNMLSTLRKKIGDVMAYWAGNFFNPFQIVGAVRQGVAVIKEYDDALIEMRKVSNETVESLRRFQDQSYGVADSVGTTALQIQKSTADFLRLGYAFKDAQEAARETTVLMNVSEFQNIDDATSAMISMKQAYEDMGLREITNELNIVGVCLNIQ